MIKDINRRDFVKAASAISVSSLLTRSGVLFAAGTEKIKVGLIGCGGRGNGSLKDFHDAAKHLGIAVEIVGLADYQKERVMDTAKKWNVSPEICYSGPDAYKKVLATNAELVLLVTPPVFRPQHFEAAIKAGKHVFMEKPIAVDVPGVRRVMESGKLAGQNKLAVVVGAQRRHQAAYLQNQYAVARGSIGKLISGQVWWCMGELWYKTRNEGESDADYLVRNWVSFTEMSGDHFVEQHFHNIDVANWFVGRMPESAMGFGGRARRKTGNQYDFFSVDFDYGDDVHIHSMARQISGSYERVAEYFVGTEGSTWGDGSSSKGGSKTKIELPTFEECGGNPYVQEHVDLLRGIIAGKPLNETQQAAETNLTCIMGRISAYTGQIIRWRELVDETVGSPWYNLKLSPTAEDFENNTVKAPAEDVFPIPGKEAKAELS